MQILITVETPTRMCIHLSIISIVSTSLFLSSSQFQVVSENSPYCTVLELSKVLLTWLVRCFTADKNGYFAMIYSHKYNSYIITINTKWHFLWYFIPNINVLYISDGDDDNDDDDRHAVLVHHHHPSYILTHLDPLKHLTMIWVRNIYELLKRSRFHPQRDNLIWEQKF